MTQSCFYGSDYLSELLYTVENFLCYKAIYDIHGFIPEDIQNTESLIQFALHDVTWIDKSKLFDFEIFNRQKEILERTHYEINLWIRISMPEVEREKVGMIKETLKEIFNISSDYMDAEYTCIEYKDDLIVYSTDEFHESFLFLMLLKR